MKDITVVQIGLGPLGIKIANFIKERNGLRTIAAVDKNPEMIGKDLGELTGGLASGIIIQGDLGDAIENEKPDIAILTTVSDMQRVTPQIEEIVAYGIPVVSTCEELAHPWDEMPLLAKRIDEAAKRNGVAVVGTGVNPGFLMDSLPTFLTAVCQHVEHVQVNRYQDAQFRRLPFQKKIGAGLTLEEFEKRRQDGSLRHVGLTESMQFIAHRMGWKLTKTEDIIEPVIAEHDLETMDLHIKKGQARGVRQVGNAYVDDLVVINLVFQATVGEPESYDEVIIKGNPNIISRIPGGINGDVATCAIVLNAIPQVLRAKDGLQTMGDIPLVSFFS